MLYKRLMEQDESADPAVFLESHEDFFAKALLIFFCFFALH